MVEASLFSFEIYMQIYICILPMENEQEYSFESTFEATCYLPPFHCVLMFYRFLIPLTLASLAWEYQHLTCVTFFSPKILKASGKDC